MSTTTSRRRSVGVPAAAGTTPKKSPGRPRKAVSITADPVAVHSSFFYSSIDIILILYLFFDFRERALL